MPFRELSTAMLLQECAESRRLQMEPLEKEPEKAPITPSIVLSIVSSIIPIQPLYNPNRTRCLVELIIDSCF